MSVARQFAVNVVAQGLARVLSIGANLVLVVVVARSMGTAFFGQFSYLLAFSTIAVAFADLGTTAVLARGLAQHTGARAAYLGNFLVMRLALGLVVMVVACGTAFALPRELLAALLIVAAGLPVLASRFFEPIYQVYERPWLSPWSNVAFGVAQLLLALAVWSAPSMSITLLSGGIVATNLVYTGVAAWMMLRLVRPDMRPRPQLLRSIVQLSAPLGVGTIFATIIVRADVIFLEHLRGMTEVGLYSAAYRVLDLAIFAAVTVITPLIPILTNQIGQDRQAALAQCRLATQVAGLVTLPLAIVLPTVSAPILAGVLGPQFAAAAAPMNILVCNFVLIVFALLGSSINLANGEVAHAYWNAPLACVINLSLNYLLIPRLGMAGAAWAAVASQCAMVAVSQFYVLTRFGSVYEPRPWGRLVLACAILWGCLRVTAPAGPWLSALLSLALYTAAAAWLGLFPRQIVDTLRAARSQRRRQPGSPSLTGR